jgi:hypothetical protein
VASAGSFPEPAEFAEPSLPSPISAGLYFMLPSLLRHAVLTQALTLVASSLASSAPAFAQELAPLKYNNPGLIVDLGVGLWAWPIPCDADGDGDFDLLVSCPDKPSNGIWFFENATGSTSINRFPIFRPAKWLSRTVHYVMPSYVNGQLRVLSPGFEYQDVSRSGLSKKSKLPIDPSFHKPAGTQPKGPKVRHNQWRMVDFDGDQRTDLVVGIEDWSDYGWDDAWDASGRWINGPLHGWVYVLLNRGTESAPEYAPPQKLQAAGQVLEVFGCPSPNFADFDADGDLDLICGEFLDGMTYFQNIGTRVSPEYSAGRRLEASDGRPLTMELQMIVPVAFDWDLDGDPDLVTGDEDGRVALLENVTPADHRDAPIFHPPVYFQQQADTIKCGALATPVGFDWDGDGDTDIISGNTAGYIEVFRNLSGPGQSEPVWAAPEKLRTNSGVFRIQAGSNGSIQGPAEAKWGYTTLSIADWDHDGLPDILFNSILGKVHWLKNVGSRQEPRFSSAEPVVVEWNGAQPELAWGWLKPEGSALLTQWRTTPLAMDFNGDQLTDLVMLDHEGYLAFFERVRVNQQLLLKAPRRAFVDRSGQPLRLTSGLAGRSGRRKLCGADWNGDGRLDLLLNSANADLLRQVEYRDGLWVMEPAGTLAKQNIEGHDVSPTVVDFESDGVLDFVGGAEDGRMYFLQNRGK